MNPELVEVVIAPAEGGLEDLMELGEVGVATDEQAPPDHRTDATEHDAELVDGQGARLNDRAEW